MIMVVINFLINYLKSILIPFKWNIINNVAVTLPNGKSYENIISLTFNYAWHSITRRIDTNYPDLIKSVLQSSRVKNAIEKCAFKEYCRTADTVVSSHKTNIVPFGKNEYTSSSSPSPSSALCSAKENAKVDPVRLQQLIRNNRSKAKEYFLEIRSSVSSTLLRIAGWILYRLLSRMFTSVQFNKQQLERIRAECEKAQKNVINNNNGSNTIPIIYLPVHRSNLDYILISFILSMNNLRSPLIALNDSLRISFFGQLMKGLGVFFIKKRPSTINSNDGELEPEPDALLYDAILQSYIIENLRHGNSLEIFVEDRRTCNGKMTMPELQLLSIVFDGIAEGSIQQVCIVPVSVSYEKLIGKSWFVEEQLGECEQTETFISTLRAIWTALHTNYGTARLDFGKPFILNEFINQIMAQKQIEKIIQNTVDTNEDNENQLAEKTSRSAELNEENPFSKFVHCVACEESPIAATVRDKSKCKLELVIQNISGTLVHDDEQQRLNCIYSLAKHVLHDAYQDSAIMSTHLVAFILMNKYKNRATTVDQLAADIDWLRRTICRDKQQNLSIFGDNFSLIRQAMQFFDKELITTEVVSLKWSSWHNNNHKLNYGKYYDNNNGKQEFWSNGNSEYWNSNQNGYSKRKDKSSKIELIYLRMANNVRSQLHLQHYANTCATLFKLESVIALSLQSFVNVPYTALIYDQSTLVSNLSINKLDFINRCKSICHTLQYEFIFAKNCQSLDSLLERTFEYSFVKQDLFVLNPNRPTGITLAMSDLNPHHNNNHKSTIMKGNYLSSSTTMSTTSPPLSSSLSSSSAAPILFNKSLLSKTNTDSRQMRRRRRLNLNLPEGGLQNECILEVDEVEYDDDDQQFVNDKYTGEFFLRITEKNGQLIALYKSILEPYMQAYWLVAHNLSTLLTDDNIEPTLSLFDEEQFFKNTMQTSQRLAQHGSIHYECTSKQTFYNAIRYFQSIGAIERITGINNNGNNGPESIPMLSSSRTNGSHQNYLKCLLTKQELLILANSMKKFI